MRNPENAARLHDLAPVIVGCLIALSFAVWLLWPQGVTALRLP